MAIIGDIKLNLINDRWLCVQRASGKQDTVRLSAVAASDDPVVTLVAPRADFRGALYQLLIGLLQTSYAPEDLSAWQELWHNPPTEADLEQAFAPYQSAFELDSEGPAFMQDLDLPETQAQAIHALLIESPGEQTVKQNKDHFVHRGTVQGMCPSCAATALFTLQINAPSGGAGHRVSVRGGGPLTTLLMPQDQHASLWHQLWLNVVPQEVTNYPAHNPAKNNELGAILPWLVATRSSDPKAQGVATTPQTVHPLQAYWSMPRRIRLDFSCTEQGHCDLCGVASSRLLRQYRTRNYGTNYTGAWEHLLTPYTHDPKGQNIALPLKGQKGGIGYRHWLGLTLGNENSQPAAAQQVRHFNKFFWGLPVAVRQTRLWCFGFDMDNMKARCWYDSTLPIHQVSDLDLPDFKQAVKHLLDVANEAASLLHKQVKAARFSRPGEVASEPAIGQNFWSETEPRFYAELAHWMVIDFEQTSATMQAYRRWLSYVHGATLNQFDDWVLSAPIEDMKMERVVQARAALDKWLRLGKATKELWKLVNLSQKKEAA